MSPGGSLGRERGWGVVLRLLGLQASAHLPALNPRDVQLVFRFVLHLHLHLRARAHTH